MRKFLTCVSLLLLLFVITACITTRSVDVDGRKVEYSSFKPDKKLYEVVYEMEPLSKDDWKAMRKDYTVELLADKEKAYGEYIAHKLVNELKVDVDYVHLSVTSSGIEIGGFDLSKEKVSANAYKLK